MTKKGATMAEVDVTDILAEMDKPKTITFSTGITLPLKQISPLFFNEFQKSLNKRLPVPEPPTMTQVTMEHPEGERIVNAADPDYLAAVDARRNVFGERMFDFLILAGLEVTWPDEEWLEEMEIMGMDVPDSTPAKKVAYVRQRCIGNVSDIERLTSECMRSLTVTEKAVDAATESFRS